MHATKLRKTVKSIFAFLAVLLLAGPALAADQVPPKVFRQDLPVELTADYVSYDKEADSYYGRGNVVITQGNATVKADSALVDMRSGIATAMGNISGIDEGGDIFSGDALHMDIKERTIVLAKGRLFFQKEHIYLWGDSLKKTGPATYAAEKVTITPCDCKEDEKPAWSFFAYKGDVTLGQYLTGYHAFFEVKGVPLLYTPYLKIPIKNERESGFLPPTPGYSRLRGFVLENAYFWAISNSTDATFDLDVETSRGLGKGVEYRYYRTKKSFGEFNFYQYQEKSIDRVREFRKGTNMGRPMSAGNNRWQLKQQHTEYMPGGVTFKSNINVVSDDEYFIDFGDTGKERSLESLESNAALSKSWSSYSLVGQFRYFDNLLVKDKSATLHRLPEITFNGADQRIYASPFYFSMESSFINFNRDAGVRGQRADVRPRFSLPLSPGGYFDITPSIAPRGTWYLVKEDPNGRYAERYLYDAKVDAATTFVRVYHGGFDALKAMKHTIRPKVSYLYIPGLDQTRKPVFDGVDRMPATSAVTYGFNSTLTGKFEKDGQKSYLDHLYLDVSQTFDINEYTKRLEMQDSKRRPFSDISLEAIVKPAGWLKLTGKEKYDVYMKWPTSYDVSIDASDSRGDSLSVTERFLRNMTRYLEGSARLRVANPLDLTYMKRFSFDQGKSLETAYGIEYRHQCYGAALSYTVKPEEKVFFLTVNLMGLGKVAGIKGSLM